MIKLIKNNIGIILLGLTALTFVLLLWQLSLLGKNIYTAISIDSMNWGLSFREENKEPVGNSTKEELREFDAYYIGSTDKKKVYLTFDSGYENGYTSHILDVLEKNDVKASFFVVGGYIEDNLDLAKRIVEGGNLLCNHTMDHPDMSNFTNQDEFNTQLLGVEKIANENGIKLSKFYRPPSGIYNQSNLTFAKELGYKTIFWSLAYADWHNDNQPTQQDAMNKLMPRLHNGAIILLHSTSKTNSEILERFIQEAKGEGYEFCLLNELE